jgi:Tfp pilus assembly protein PilV
MPGRPALTPRRLFGYRGGVMLAAKKCFSSRAARRRAGFTIIEVTMAAFVMVFGIATSLSVLSSGLRTLDDARNITLASQILQSELERLRLLPWSSSTGGEAISGLEEKATVDLATAYSSNTAVTGRFTLTRVVTATSGRETTMRDITLVVSWTSVFGTAHTRTFTTRYCKDGLYDFYYTLAK